MCSPLIGYSFRVDNYFALEGVGNFIFQKYFVFLSQRKFSPFGFLLRVFSFSKIFSPFIKSFSPFIKRFSPFIKLSSFYKILPLFQKSLSNDNSSYNHTLFEDFEQLSLKILNIDIDQHISPPLALSKSQRELKHLGVMGLINIILRKNSLVESTCCIKYLLKINS